MHAAEKSGQVRRVTDKGKDFLVYAREDINVRLEISEKLKVKLGEEAAEELESGNGDDDSGDVEVEVS